MVNKLPSSSTAIPVPGGTGASERTFGEASEAVTLSNSTCAALVGSSNLAGARAASRRLAWPLATLTVIGLSAVSWLSLFGLYAMLFR